MAFKPRLSWDESASGHFNHQQLKELSVSDPKVLVKNLLEKNDGPTVVYTMVELLRHGEGGILLTLHENRKLMNLWEKDTVSSNDYENLLDVVSFFKDHVQQISFRETRR